MISTEEYIQIWKSTGAELIEKLLFRLKGNGRILKYKVGDIFKCTDNDMRIVISRSDECRYLVSVFSKTDSFEQLFSEETFECKIELAHIVYVGNLFEV